MLHFKLQHLAPKEKRMESQLTQCQGQQMPAESQRPLDCLGRVVWGCWAAVGNAGTRGRNCTEPLITQPSADSNRAAH